MFTDADAVTVTTDEAARRVGVSARTIRRWIVRGILPATATPEGYLIAVTALAGVRDGAGQRPRPRGHTVTDAATVTDTTVTVNPSARAQLEAIRDEWLQPLVETISQQAERIGRLEAERDSAAAQLAAKNETLAAKDELIADLRAELRRRAERDRLAAAQVTQDALGAPEQAEEAQHDASGVWGRLQQWWRG